LGSVKGKEFLDQVSDYQFLKKEPALCSSLFNAKPEALAVMKTQVMVFRVVALCSDIGYHHLPKPSRP
jgi:hypothetical protein